jgi:hypothetical protein
MRRPVAREWVARRDPVLPVRSISAPRIDTENLALRDREVLRNVGHHPRPSLTDRTPNRPTLLGVDCIKYTIPTVVGIKGCRHEST